MLKPRHFSLPLALSALLAGIIIIVLRFYQLGNIPQGLTKDEAYYGYDAYSIMQTGRDIWGQRFPLRFKSTGEYKLNLTYLIIPVIKLFDLTERAVRTPSAIFGLLTLPLLYATLRYFALTPWLSLLLVIVYSFSPWSFGMSRLFYESNVGLFFIALGFYGALKLLRSQNGYWSIITPVSLALAAYLYGPYLYIGLSLLVLALGMMRRHFRSLFIYSLLLVPLLISMRSGGLTRLTQEWALKMPGYTMEADNARMNCYLSFGHSSQLAKLCYPYWNKPINQLRDITLTTLRTFSPEYLFFSGVNTYITPDSVGAYPLSLFPLYLFGIVAITRLLSPRSSRRLPTLYLILSLLLATAVVALPGRVELYRDPVGLYLLFIIFALGARWFIQALFHFPSILAYVTLTLYALIIGFDQTRFLLSYFTSYTRSHPLVFSSDAREVYNFLSTHRDYQYIVDRKFHGPIFAAFFWKIDPTYFQTHVEWTAPDNWGWINAKSVGNVYSTEMTISHLLALKAQNPHTPIRALVVSDPDPLYTHYASLKTYDANGSLHLHDVYDIDQLYSALNPSPLQ